MRRFPLAVGALAVAVCGAVMAVGASQAPAPSSSPLTVTTAASAPTTAPATSFVQARAVLATLPVKGRAPKTGYSRAQFGQTWTDDTTAPGGHNRCDTRNDILAAQLTKVAKQGSCTVVSGMLVDPYTGKTIFFQRGVCTAGQTTGCSDLVQIDHVVPLSDAWQTGAQQLDMTTRTALANDPLNLQATDGPTNAAKGDSDAASWLPMASYRCTYVTRQVQVKHRYQLWVTQAEHDAIDAILARC